MDKKRKISFNFLGLAGILSFLFLFCGSEIKICEEKEFEGIILADAGSRHGKMAEMKLTDKNIETLLALSKKGGKIRSYLTHKDSGLGREIGYFHNFRIVGRSLVGDFVFYDFFKKNRPKEYLAIREIALESPELIAISMAVAVVPKIKTEQENVWESLWKDSRGGFSIMYIYSYDWVGQGAYTDILK
jgi:hypothetical protein